MNAQIIAKRYAEALFDQAGKHKNAKKIWEELHNLAELSGKSADFANLIKNPLIFAHEKEVVFKTLKDSGKISKILYDFLCLLIEKKRLAILAEIDMEISKLVLAQNGEIEVEATFAATPKTEMKKELEKKISDITGKKVILKEIVDPSVIGGVKVRMGSMLYDATVKGQLEKLKASLV